MSFHVPNDMRIRKGQLASDDSYGNNGAFIVPMGHKQTVFVIASDGMDWEHVSVSRKDRCPNWAEMCFIKELFWDDEDCVVQYHPRESEYVNDHDYVLHLWRPTKEKMPTPPIVMV